MRSTDDEIRRSCLAARQQLLEESLAEGQRVAALQEVNETAHREAHEDNDDNEDNEGNDDNEDNEDNVGQDDLIPTTEAVTANTEEVLPAPTDTHTHNQAPPLPSSPGCQAQGVCTTPGSALIPIGLLRKP